MKKVPKFLLVPIIVLFLFLGIETGFHLAIWAGFLRYPHWYTNFFVDSDYFKLRLLWGLASQPRVARLHPVFGWAQSDVTQTNPLGLREGSFSLFSSKNSRKIFFYGDSYVKGGVDIEFSLPNLMNNSLKNYKTVDLGVGGHGLDQSYLVFLESTLKQKPKLAIVGILIENSFERVVLGFRTWQKPYYTPSDKNSFALSGLPIENDFKSYLTKHPIQIKSYLASFLKTRFFPDHNKRDEVTKTASFVLHEWIKQLKENKIELLFVLFTADFMKPSDWRKTAILEILNNEKVPVLDTSKVLTAHFLAHSLQKEAYYFDFHHTKLGNEIIAQEILRVLKERGFN